MIKNDVRGALLAVVILTVLGCRSQLADGAEVTELGEFEYADGSRLVVSEEKGLLRYFVVGGGGKEVIRSVRNASIYQKWMIVWDGSELWFTSSDIGSFVWTQQHDGRFITFAVSEAPEEVREKEPSSIRSFSE